MKDPGPILGGVLVFVGSGAGGLLRHYLGTIIQNAHGPRFPMGTLVVNVTGCFVMGLCVGAWAGSTPIREDVRLALLIGVLGGYTTFSSFGRDFYLLVAEGEWTRAMVYAIASVVISLLAVWAGAAVSSRFFGTQIG